MITEDVEERESQGKQTVHKLMKARSRSSWNFEASYTPITELTTVTTSHIFIIVMSCVNSCHRYTSLRII